MVVLFFFCKVWNVCKDVTVSYGVFRHQRYHEYLHALKVRGCQGRIGKIKSERAGKKGNVIGGYGIC